MQSFGILTWATKETLRDEYSYRYDAPIKEEEGQRNETLQHVAVLHWYFLSQAPLEGYFWKQMSSASPYLLFLASGWPVNLVRFILCVCAQLCPTLCSPMDHQAHLSLAFSRQECWSWLPFSSPEDLLDPGIKPKSPALAGRFFIPEPTMKPSVNPVGDVIVIQLCPTLWDPMDRNLPGSSVHRILQAKILRWVAVSFSRGSSRPRDQSQVSYIAGGLFTNWATREIDTQ